jgi:hypothetical protein
MVKQIVTKIPQDHSEVDQLIMDWLATHHILAKDVRAYVINRRVGEPEIMTLEVITSGVDTIEPAAGLNHPGSDRWTGGDRKDEA